MSRKLRRNILKIISSYEKNLRYNVGKSRKSKNKEENFFLHIICFALVNSIHKKHKLILTSPLFLQPPSSAATTTTIILRRRCRKRKHKECFTSGSGKFLTPHTSHSLFPIFLSSTFSHKNTRSLTHTLHTTNT